MGSPVLALVVMSATFVACFLVVESFWWASLLAMIIFPTFVLSQYAPRSLQSSTAFLVRGIKDVFYRRHVERTFDFSKIEDHVFLGKMPRNLDDLALLKKEGIETIIILNEAWELSVTVPQKEAEFKKVLHIPSPDYFSPTPEQIQAGVECIKQNVASQQGVYVHCFAGRGRSAVVVIAYLVAKNKWDPLKAWTYAKSKRSVVSDMPGLGGIRPQWKSLMQWYNTYYVEK